MSSNLRSSGFQIAAITIIIVFAIAIAFTIQGEPDKAMSKVVTAGPVWPTDSWQCTSDADFVIHATLLGVGEDPQIRISVHDHGTSGIYHLTIGQEAAFSIGNQAEKPITITKTGSISGFLTLQTTSDAEASCKSI